jgi:hypothetical protein
VYKLADDGFYFDEMGDNCLTVEGHARWAFVDCEVLLRIEAPRSIIPLSLNPKFSLAVTETLTPKPKSSLPVTETLNPKSSLHVTETLNPKSSLHVTETLQSAVPRNCLP